MGCCFSNNKVNSPTSPTSTSTSSITRTNEELPPPKRRDFKDRSEKIGIPYETTLEKVHSKEDSEHEQKELKLTSKFSVDTKNPSPNSAGSHTIESSIKSPKHRNSGFSSTTHLSSHSTDDESSEDDTESGEYRDTVGPINSKKPAPTLIIEPSQTASKQMHEERNFGRGRRRTDIKMFHSPQSSDVSYNGIRDEEDDDENEEFSEYHLQEIMKLHGSQRGIKTPSTCIKKPRDKNLSIHSIEGTEHSIENSRFQRRKQKRRPGVHPGPRMTMTWNVSSILNGSELMLSPRKFSEKHSNLHHEKPVEFLTKTLRKNHLFSGVDEEYRDRMISKCIEAMRYVECRKDSELIRQGDIGDAFYIVEKGKFDILVTESVDEEDNDDEINKINHINNIKRINSGSNIVQISHQSPNSLLRIKSEDTNHNMLRLKSEDTPKISNCNSLNSVNSSNSNNTTYINNSINTNTNNTTATTTTNNNNNNNNNSNNHNKNNSIKLSIHVDSSEINDDEKKDIIKLINSRVIKVGEADVGDGVGEYALLYNTPRSATLKAVVDSAVWGIGALEFVEIRKKLAEWNVQRFEKRKKFLSTIPLFSKLEDHQLMNLTHACGVSVYRDQQPILKPDDNIDDLFVIYKGSVIVEKKTKGSVSYETDDETKDEMYDNNIKLKKGFIVESDEDIIIKENKRKRKPKVSLGLGMETRVEYGKREYFGRKLFQLNVDEPEIRSARCDGAIAKLLRIKNDDFRLILAELGSHIIGSEEAIHGQLPQTFSNRVNCKLNSFEVIKILGIGSFGKVSLVKDKATTKIYALKEVRMSRIVETGQVEHIINEKRVMGMIDCIFCIKLYATYRTYQSIFFLTQVVLGGELWTLLRYNKKFDEEASRFYCSCVILAFEHLHKKDIIYRDLKPENLLLDRNGYVLLTDFGFAKKRNTTTTLCGTPQYLAPEVIHNWVQSFGVDWWALGILLYEMVVGRPPFEDDEHTKMYEKILVSDPSFPNNCTAQFRSIVENLLEKNAYQRLGSGLDGSADVKKHPFFKDFDWNAVQNKSMKAPYKPVIQNDTDTSNFETFEDPFPPCEEDNVVIDSPLYKWAEEF